MSCTKDGLWYRYPDPLDQGPYLTLTLEEREIDPVSVCIVEVTVTVTTCSHPRSRYRSPNHEQT